ncbi:hypothetical protein [Paenibacillus sp. FSL H8-0332]
MLYQSDGFRQALVLRKASIMRAVASAYPPGVTNPSSSASVYARWRN